MSEVISIFSYKKDEESEDKSEDKGEDTSYMLEKNVELNKKKEERLRKERQTANKSVLRSYRVKK